MGEMPRSLATCLVVAPSATRWRISRSRLESGVVSGAASPIRTSSMNVRVSWGWMTALPSIAFRAASTSASAEASLSK